MLIREIKTLLDAQILSGEQMLDQDVAEAFASDMMSDVLAFANPHCVLLTGLCNPQVIRTAEMLDVSCIVFVRGKPLGLDEIVEQGGRNFSGGQRQRLTIARALVRKPAILILDDSASALDFATDAALRKSLRALPWHPTVFLVSQRTASLRQADQILVLDDGHLVGMGTHETLLDTCPIYREIFESQFEKGGAAG